MIWNSVLEWMVAELQAAPGMSGVKVRRAAGELPSATGVYVEMVAQRRGEQWANAVELRLHFYSTQGEEHCAQLMTSVYSAVLTNAGQPKSWAVAPSVNSLRVHSVFVGETTLPQRDGDHANGYAAMIPLTVRASPV